MSTGNQRLTFISYSRADGEFALELAKALRSSGFNIWLDQLDIHTGVRWDDAIEKALRQCEIFMVILTPSSTASDNVKDEIGYAIDMNKRIMPVLLKNAELPLRLRRFQYVNFTGKTNEQGVEAAKQFLQNLLNELELQSVKAPILPESLVTAQRQSTPAGRSPQPPAPLSRQQQPQPISRSTVSPQPPGKPTIGFKTIPLLALLLLVCVGATALGMRLLSPAVQTETPTARNMFPNAIPTVTDRPLVAHTASSPQVLKPESNPTHTFIPSTQAPPSTNTTIPTETIPTDPAAFIYFYFDNINKRNYDLTWSLLSDQYKAKSNPSGINQYIGFWDGYNSVVLTSVDYSYISDTSAKVLLNAVFNKAGTSSNQKITYYLTNNNPQRVWQFDIAPATMGSSSDTTCSKSPRTLSVGIVAEVVTATDPLLLRDSPVEGAGVLEKMAPGTIVLVVDGPLCGTYRSVYFWWWKVQAPSGRIGWVVEGSDVTDISFILPTD